MNLSDEVRKFAQDPNRPRDAKIDGLIEAQQEIEIWLSDLEYAEDEYDLDEDVFEVPDAYREEDTER